MKTLLHNIRSLFSTLAGWKALVLVFLVVLTAVVLALVTGLAVPAIQCKFNSVINPSIICVPDWPNLLLFGLAFFLAVALLLSIAKIRKNFFGTTAALLSKDAADAGRKVVMMGLSTLHSEAEDENNWPLSIRYLVDNFTFCPSSYKMAQI